MELQRNLDYIGSPEFGRALLCVLFFAQIGLFYFLIHNTTSVILGTIAIIQLPATLYMTYRAALWPTFKQQMHYLVRYLAYILFFWYIVEFIQNAIKTVRNVEEFEDINVAKQTARKGKKRSKKASVLQMVNDFFGF